MRDFSTYDLVAMLLRQVGGRIVIEPEAVADMITSFTLLDRGDGSYVLLNLAFSEPEDKPLIDAHKADIG